VCDGTSQCSNGEDEVNCCRPGQFRCTTSGVCISAAALCDDWENCADGSDESAPACASANNHRQAVDPNLDAGKSTYVVAVLVVMAATVLVVLGFYYCRRRLAGNEDLPDILHDSAGDPLSPKSCRMAKPMLAQKNARKDLKPGMAVRMSTLNGSSISSSYDRSHITGFSYCSLSLFFIKS
jgi:low density lipoprotein receptor-related protein 5/6